MIELVFLFFGHLSNLAFDCRITDHRKVPRLQIRAARRAPGYQQTILFLLPRLQGLYFLEWTLMRVCERDT